MPYDGSSNQAVVMLDLLLNFYKDNKNWTRGNVCDLNGDRCILGAVAMLRGRHRIYGEGTCKFILRAGQELGRPWRSIMNLNDECESYDELYELLNKAKEIALLAPASLRRSKSPDKRLGAARSRRPTAAKSV